MQRKLLDMNIGDIVKINYNNILNSNMHDLKPNLLDYILDNKEKEYKIIEIDENLMCRYILEDNVLNVTSFSEEELILV